MSSPRLIGHPDFLATNGTPVPVLFASWNEPATGTWEQGPFTITSGGAYMIACGASSDTVNVLTDITVQQFDAAGNLVWIDFFGAVPAGIYLPGVYQTLGPTVVRGNIYGTTLKVFGQIATAAYCDTVFGTTGLSVGTLFCNLYVLPNGLGDPDPKLSSGGVFAGSSLAAVPGNFLAGVNGVSVPAATVGAPQPLIPYSGPAYMMIRNTTGSATPNDAQYYLKYYTVANGTAPFQEEIYEATTVNFPFPFNLNIPACLATLTLDNLNAANAVIFYASIIANRTA